MRLLQRGLLGLIVLAGLYASVQNLLATRSLGRLGDDPVADWEQRFAPIRQRLPFQRGLVGYISASSVPGASYDAANEEGEYVLTQYAMAPVILVKGADQEWDIANLDRAAFEAWSRANGEAFEVVVSRGGLYLLHRVGN